MPQIFDCISKVISKMSDEEKGLLYIILTYGKHAKSEAEHIINDSKQLASYGKHLNEKWVAQTMEDCILTGTGFMDCINDITDNYGKQLDLTIKEVIVKSLKIPMPIFSKNTNFFAGVVQRETWIVEQLMNSIIIDMGEDRRREFSKQIEQLLKAKGCSASKATEVGAAIVVGGLTTAKTIMGFNFHIVLAQVSNIIVRAITGKGLSLVANATLQKSAGLFLGPVGWIITGILTLPLLTSLINPRNYDKFLPAVFIIGVSRLANTLKRSLLNEFIIPSVNMVYRNRK